jgi:hypothetical protein
MTEKTWLAIRGVNKEEIEKFRKESKQYRNQAILFEMMLNKWFKK